MTLREVVCNDQPTDNYHLNLQLYCSLTELFTGFQLIVHSHRAHSVVFSYSRQCFFQRKGCKNPQSANCSALNGRQTAGEHNETFSS